VTAGFYPLSGNPSGFLTSAPVTSVAGRTGAITLANTDISGLGTMATATAADYSTTTAANALYYPLSGNPSGFLTASSLTGYATESFVTSQGYITSSALSPYLLSSTAASTYYLQTNPAGYINATTLGNGSAPAGEDILDGLQNAVAPSTSNPYATEGYTDSSISSFAATLSSTYATLASPTFTGTPSLPTGTIGVTQTAGNNTTALATTAFVTAAVPAFAATTNVIFDPSSTTLALNPSLVPQFLANSNYRNFSSLNQTSVSGSAAVSQFGSSRELYTNSTSVAGRATFMNAPYGFSFMALSSKSNSNIIDWSKKIWVFGTAILGRSTYVGNANTVTRINLGGRSANATGNLTQKGIGLFKVGGTGTFINLTVHDGTTLTSVASSVTLASDATVHYIIYSDGAGNVQLYLDGVLAASTTAGPTGSGTSGHNIYEEQIESATSSGSLSSMHIAGAGIYMSR
jgi:hypothetical protein